MEVLAPLLAPTSVAVVGASDDPASFGGRFWAHLARSTSVERFAVNTRPLAVRGAAQARSLDELPHAPDLVIVATPASTVESLVAQSVAVGARAVIVLPSVPGKARDRVRKLCANRVQLLGGSSLGIVDANKGVVLSSSVSLELPLGDGPLGLVSQSGALMGILHARAIHRGLGLGFCGATGEQLGVRVEDLVLALAGDEQLCSIGAYVEDVDPEAFARAACRVGEAGKVLVVLKGGVSPDGAAAAAAHSGALGSDGRAFRAMAGDLGAVVASDPDDLLHCMYAARIAGRRFFLGTLSGGLAAVGADLAASQGVELAVPSDPASPVESNPVDLDARCRTDADAAETVRLLATDPGADGLVLVVSDRPDLPSLLDALAGLDRSVRARLHLASECSEQFEPALRAHPLAGLGYVPGMARLLAAIAKTRGAAVAEGVPAPAPSRAVATSAGTVLDAGRPSPTTDLGSLLPAKETWALLADAGVPALPLWDVVTVADLEGLLAQHGAALVLKRDGVAHRHRDEVVFSSTRDEVLAAFKNLAERGPVVAQPLAVPGLEFFVGIRRDRVFGPVFMVGAGGRGVEERADVAVHVGLPDPARIVHLVDQTAAGSWARPSTGAGLVDLDDLCRVAALLCSWFSGRRDLWSVDLNPVSVGPTGAVVVDAKMRVGGGAHHGGHYGVPRNEQSLTETHV